MDQSNLSNSDPTILLLNEIEILLAQTRLMELYVKQAQATAANDAMRRARQHQAESAALRAALAAKEQDLIDLQANIVVPDPRLGERLDQLEAELVNKQGGLDDRQAELAMARDEIATLHARMSEVEAARQQSQTAAAQSDEHSKQLQVELDGLRQELEKNRCDFDAQLARSRQLEESLAAELQQLQHQLGETQRSSEHRESELISARNEIAGLQQRVDELQASRQRLEAKAGAELEQTRARFGNELAELQNTLAGHARERQESQAASAELQSRLSNEIVELRAQLETKRQQLTGRDDECRQAQIEIAVLQQQMLDLQAKNQQAENINAELTKHRQESENEIAELQHEVEVKERELIQRYEAVSAVELALHGRIQALQQELDYSRQEISIGHGELDHQRAEILALNGKIADLEIARAAAESAGKRYVDETRQRVEDELNRLHATLAQKDHALKEQESAFKNLEEQFNGDVAEQRHQLEREQGNFQTTNVELARVREELAAQQQLNGNLEKARQEAEDNWQRAGIIQNELQSRLQAKTDELGAAHASAADSREHLETKIAQLQSELAQQQAEHETRGAAISERENQLQQLQTRLGELESAHRQAADRLQESEQSRAAQQVELANLHDEYRNKFATRESETAQARQEALQAAQASANELRAELESKISVLHSELTEKQSWVDGLNAEVIDLKAKSEHSVTQLTELDSARRQVAEVTRENEQSNAGHQVELNNLHAEYRIKFATLESELAQARQEALNAAQTSANEIRAELENKISALQSESAQKQSWADGLSAEIADLKANLEQSAAQLTELDLARRQAAALNQERDQNRATHQLEIANLNELHQSNLQAIESELSATRQNAVELEKQALDFIERNRQLAADLHARHQQIEVAGAENQALHDRLHELESQRDDQRLQVQGLERAGIALDAELAGVRQELQQKSWSLAQQQAALENLALAHKGQIQKLEARLSEQQSIGSAREGALARIQALARTLEQRVETLQGELRDARLTETGRIEQIRQENLTRIDALDALLGQKNLEIEKRDTAQANLEQSLRRDVERLLREIDGRNTILQNRNDELVRVKADLDSTLERMSQLESAQAQAETGSAGELERMRSEFQAQLALLQAELSQKEWALEERHASANGVEQEYRQQLDLLRRQLSEKESAERQLQRDFSLGDDLSARAERDTAKPEQSFNGGGVHGQTAPGDPRDRRWHSAFAWKRRWKS